MQEEVTNTILRELREFIIEEEKRWNENNKVLSNLEKETKENSEIISALKIETGGLEGKIDNLEMVIAENTVEMINIKAKIENLEKAIEELKETEEENKIHDLDFSNDSEKEQLIYNLILKVWNLTERVKALEK